jgi:hypothetical protein
LLVIAVTGSLTVAHAQRIFSGFYGSAPPKFPTATTYDGQFNFCRAMFSSPNYRQKQGWGTDYPGADLNFSTRLSELTKVAVKRVQQGNELVPDAVVVRLTDDWLFKCQFTLMEDAGTAEFSEAEVQRLRAYLLKGGFLLVSDYHGSWARERFDEEIGRVLPHASYPIVDLTPPDHPIWNTMFSVQRIPQMASIQTWRRSGKSTIERWNEDGSPPDVRGIADDHGRLMVVMVHNTDLPDPWEREGEESEYFFRFSPEAYRVGIDILIYALTH